jgi:hypothetical protein
MEGSSRPCSSLACCKLVRWSFVALLFLFSSACQRAAVTSSPIVADTPVAWLNSVEDNHAHVSGVYTDPDSGCDVFWPSWWLNGGRGLEVDPECGESPYSGAACFRITWDGSPGKDGYRWRGINFHDSPTWERHTGAGRDLSKATRLTLFWRPLRVDGVIKFVAGHFDEPQGEITRTFSSADIIGSGGLGRWHRLVIELRDRPWHNVHTALQVKIEGAAQPPSTPGTVLDIDEAFFDCPPTVSLHLPRSYQVRLGEDFRWTHNSAHVYDAAVVALAHIAIGKPEHLKRAGDIIDALIYASTHDRYFRDGRLRNAYSSGPIALTQNGEARMVSWWDPKQQRQCEDYYCVGTTTGNMAWVMIAMLEYAKQVDGDKRRKVLEVARNIGQWIAAQHDLSCPLRGFFGGFEGWEPRQSRSTWKSTEHALDIYVAMNRYASLLPEAARRPWLNLAERAREFVEEAMWHEGEGRYLVGTQPDGETPRLSPKPTDVNCWAVLAFGPTDRTVRAMTWVEKHCACTDKTSGLRGFDYNDDKDGIWWEGTAHAVLAFSTLGDHEKASYYLRQLEEAQRFYKFGGALPAASKDQLTTGLDVKSSDQTQPVVAKPWYYYRIPHVGATAWSILAQVSWNPYWGQPTSVPVPSQ